MIKITGRILLIAIILSVINFESVAQTEDEIQKIDSATYKRRYDHTWRALNIGYGALVNNNSQFNEFFSLFQSDFGRKLTYISVEYGGPSNHVDDYHLGFKYYLPKQLIIQDTISFTFSGFQIYFPLIGINTVYIKDFDLPVLFGINYSTFYLTRNNEKYLNPAFSLNLAVKPRLIYKRLVFAINLESNWDFSKAKWRAVNAPELTNMNFKNTCLGAYFSLGFMLFDYKSSYIRVYK